MFWETVESKESDNQSFFSISQSFRNNRALTKSCPSLTPNAFSLGRYKKCPSQTQLSSSVNLKSSWRVIILLTKMGEPKHREVTAQGHLQARRTWGNKNNSGFSIHWALLLPWISAQCRPFSKPEIIEQLWEVFGFVFFFFLHAIAKNCFILWKNWCAGWVWLSAIQPKAGAQGQPRPACPDRANLEIRGLKPEEERPFCLHWF